MPDPKIDAKRLAWAKDYLDTCFEQGMDVDIEGATDQEIIDQAEAIEDRADQAYDAWKERYGDL